MPHDWPDTAWPFDDRAAWARNQAPKAHAVNERETREVPEVKRARAPKPPRAKILDKAGEAILGDRDQSYGGPEDSFALIADFWRAYGVQVGGEDPTPADVAAMMILLKAARINKNAKHTDSWVDIAGYAACGAEAAGAEIES